MARPLRITTANIPLHVLDRGNNRQIIFRDEEDFIYFLKLLIKYKKEFKFKLYHICLMPNHIHLMIEPIIDGSLPRIMMRLTLAYSSYFNRRYRGVGHVWQGRYKNSIIDKDNYFIWCGLYIELNPLRAALVAKPEDWQFSSYNFYIFGKAHPLIEKVIDIDPYYYQGLGDTPERRQEKYRQYVNDVINEKFLKDTRNQLDKGVFGNEKFIREMKTRFKIRSLRSRGRPRKEEK
ncbi:MAG: hypothetical protein AUJ31_00235 [Parcubacteria group bacterium CG1_02_39_15]|uniref:Transposase IS200-like domain-containing protein n=1 Tax=Candidatus Nealsonbacteria bacterium CG_4_10_14_0_2_um_filter_39_15 TaxID=1974681 RepID=A0A2M7UWV9_9BACT|nr:MAG: hypothetical protein AUJ31_00235 [Parcubacteria group bacterium CG1_02_39_15]PIZ88449.1 MAG: hypothetical protein COX91_00075 [Candidatus Nealsonbacteria bacterium CG_4_10_14_0_2_um_filter_39_15]